MARLRAGVLIGARRVAGIGAGVCALASLSSSVAVAAPEPGVVIGLRPANHPGNVDEFDGAKGVGAKWVRLFMEWAQSEPADDQYDPVQLQSFDTRIDTYRRLGINVLIAVVKSPPWAAQDPSADRRLVQPPRDPGKYAEFIGTMARRYAGKVQAWEVWNEPDDPPFWAPGPDPALYAAMLRASYASIKAADADATVVTGGLVGAHFEFLERLYDHGAKGFFDAVGVHTATACRLDAPGAYYREPSGRIGRFAFTGYREVRQTMLAHGDAKPVWLTEIGWATRTGTCTDGEIAGTRASGVPEDTQAEFLRSAYSCLNGDDYIGPTLWFSLQDISDTESTFAHYLGLYRHDGSAKPARDAFRDVAANTPAAQPCGGVVDVKPPTVKLTAGPAYINRLRIKAVARDGETKVTRIELQIDGREVPGSGKGGTYDLNYLRARNLPLGVHTVTALAFDEGRNVGTASVKVRRVRRNLKIPTKLRVKKIRKLVGGGYRIAGRLSYLERSDLSTPGGQVSVSFERRVGGRFTRVSTASKRAGRPFLLVHRPGGPGTWRVRFAYAGNTPYAKAKPVVAVFKVD